MLATICLPNYVNRHAQIVQPSYLNLGLGSLFSNFHIRVHVVIVSISSPGTGLKWFHRFHWPLYWVLFLSSQVLISLKNQVTLSSLLLLRWAGSPGPSPPLLSWLPCSQVPVSPIPIAAFNQSKSAHSFHKVYQVFQSIPVTASLKEY